MRDFLHFNFNNTLIINDLSCEKFSQMIFRFWEFLTLAKNDAQKWGFYCCKITIFSQMMQMKRKKMDLRNILRRSFYRKKHKLLIISALAFFVFSQMFWCQQTYKKNIKKPNIFDPCEEIKCPPEYHLLSFSI